MPIVLIALFIVPYITVTCFPKGKNMATLLILNIKLKVIPNVERERERGRETMPVASRYYVPRYGCYPVWVETRKRMPLFNGRLFSHFFPLMQNCFVPIKHCVFLKVYRLHCEIGG